MRPIHITPNYISTTPSCLIEVGGTRVLCAASAEEGTPPFLKGSGRGWLTAEYAMLPASTHPRKRRDGAQKDGRGVEISRLIGRALRQAIDPFRLGERTITIDCDVIEADGGTRCAAITGGFVALTLAVDRMIREKKLFDSPVTRQVAALSAGIVDGEPVTDLSYRQDSRADVDMNIVMDELGNYIEIQGAGERAVFSGETLHRLLNLAGEGIRALLAAQREAVGAAARWLPPRLPRLIVASGNEHKARELKVLLAAHYEVLSLREAGLSVDIEETGSTFAENARLKAEAVMRLARCAALADDSGLSVDALGGAPGVYSARYAGTHGDDAANNRLLLQNMRDARDRAARFVSALALAAPGEETRSVQGEVSGTITDAPRGEGGFGYDPLFEYERGRTFAEMPDREKNEVSHRANAVRALLRMLEAGTC